MAVTGTNIDEKSTATAIDAAMEFPVRQSDGTVNSAPMTMVALEHDTTYDTAANHADQASLAMGKMYHCDLSAVATDNWLITLPTGASTNEMIGFYVTATNASFEMAFRTASGDLIDGTTYSAADWSVIWQVGEWVVFECIDGATNDWRVAGKEFLWNSGRMDVTTGEAVNTTPSTPTNWVEQWDIGGIVDAANDKLGPLRRAGKYELQAYHTTEATVDSGVFMQITIRIDPDGAPANVAVSRFHSAATNDRVTAPVSVTQDYAVGDEFDYTLSVNDSGSNYTTGTAESVRPHFAIKEVPW